MSIIINKTDVPDFTISLEDTDTNILYDFYTIDNLKSYSSEFTKWIAETEKKSEAEKNAENSEKSENQYFILDNDQGNEAFAHWVYESAIYLPIYKELKKIYPNLKIFLKSEKKFKKLFFDFFDIDAVDTCTELQKNNISIFYRPMTSLNDKELDTMLMKQILYFIGFFRCESLKSNDVLFMPRQKIENFKPNDRSYDTECLEKEIINNNWRILHTDTVTCLRDQIKQVNESKIVVLTDGSPLLVNGIFARDSLILIIGNVTYEQFHLYPKMKFISKCITEINNNKIMYTINKQIASVSKKYLKSGTLN